MPPLGEDNIQDEVKTYHDEVGDQDEETPCERSSNKVDLRDVKMGLVNERSTERERENERNRNGERLRMSQAESHYRQLSSFAHAQAAQAAGLYGSLHNPGNPYGLYHPMGLPFGGFPSVSPPQLGGMHLPRPVPVPANHFGLGSFPHVAASYPNCGIRSSHPHDPSGMLYGHGSKMVPSPLGGSPSPAAFLMNNKHTPPPAHMGGGVGSRSVSCSPFTAPHPSSFPLTDMMSQWAYFSNLNRTTPPMTPSMASPFNHFNPYTMRPMGSPMGMPFSPPHFMPAHSPLPNGRFPDHLRHEVSSSRMSHADSSASSTSSNRDPSEGRFHRQSKRERLQSHVKKPLNAFMLYMKEMRATVQSECTLKESAAINQILGKKWHALDRTEQAKYYEMAKLEREAHARNNPGWTAKDNYAQCGKKKRRKKEKSDEPKKCRAIFGIDRQSDWCKPCRRKKKCIRFSQNGALLPNGGRGGGGDRGDRGGVDGMEGMDGIDFIREPKSSASDSVPHVSSSMQTLSPSADSAASSNSPSSSAAASSG